MWLLDIARWTSQYEFAKIEIKTKHYAENENPVNHKVSKMISRYLFSSTVTVSTTTTNNMDWIKSIQCTLWTLIFFKSKENHNNKKNIIFFS
jgi:hypothetical protein